MNITFHPLEGTNQLPYEQAVTLAVEEAESGNHAGVVFKHQKGTAKIVNLNVFKGMRSTDKRICCVAKAKSNMFVLN